MTTNAPPAAPITAERQNLLARIDRELSDFRREGSWYVCADREPNDLDGGVIAVDDAMRIARAALSAPVAAQPAASGVDALWVRKAMELAARIEAAGARRGREGRAPSDHEPEMNALEVHLSTALTGAAKE